MMFRFSSGSAQSGLVLCAVLLLGVGDAARAEEVETRDFAAKIDGSPVGQYRMSITRRENGSVTMTCAADLKMTKLGITAFHYTYRGTEVWSSDRLVSLRSNADADGPKTTGTAPAETTRAPRTGKG